MSWGRTHGPELLFEALRLICPSRDPRTMAAVEQACRHLHAEALGGGVGLELLS
ncbi:MAG: hypothetical protein JXX28_11510 [Deltaproteobacteria bacterium]|nr:hypothetical protein [Deltaproteobacteria bacterium]